MAGGAVFFAVAAFLARGAAFLAGAFAAAATFFAGAGSFDSPARPGSCAREMTLRAAEAACPASDLRVLRAMERASLGPGTCGGSHSVEGG